MRSASSSQPVQSTNTLALLRLPWQVTNVQLCCTARQGIFGTGAPRRRLASHLRKPREVGGVPLALLPALSVRGLPPRIGFRRQLQPLRHQLPLEPTAAPQTA